jgi:hypothetical protein
MLASPEPRAPALLLRLRLRWHGPRRLASDPIEPVRAAGSWILRRLPSWFGRLWRRQLMLCLLVRRPLRQRESGSLTVIANATRWEAEVIFHTQINTSASVPMATVTRFMRLAIIVLSTVPPTLPPPPPLQGWEVVCRDGVADKHVLWSGFTPAVCHGLGAVPRRVVCRDGVADGRVLYWFTLQYCKTYGSAPTSLSFLSFLLSRFTHLWWREP